MTISNLFLVKQEKVESKPIPTPKVSQHQRRLKPAQVTGEQIFQNEGEILFIQVRWHILYSSTIVSRRLICNYILFNVTECAA